MPDRKIDDNFLRPAPPNGCVVRAWVLVREAVKLEALDWSTFNEGKLKEHWEARDKDAEEVRTVVNKMIGKC